MYCFLPLSHLCASRQHAETLDVMKGRDLGKFQSSYRAQKSPGVGEELHMWEVTLKVAVFEERITNWYLYRITHVEQITKKKAGPYTTFQLHLNLRSLHSILGSKVSRY